MNKPSPSKNPLLYGTLLLTASGVLCRILGFLYRIFLSRTIGAREVGIYQLVFPISVLLLSLCSAGMQTTISNFVAKKSSARHDDVPSVRAIAGIGLGLSGGLSILLALPLWFYAPYVAQILLQNDAYAAHLKVIALYILPATLHACINGYYYGRKKASVPALTQVIEQLARILGVWLLYQIVHESHQEFTAVYALWGLVIGELFGLLASLIALCLEKCTPTSTCHKPLAFVPQMLCYAIPLVLNHTLLHLCSCVENILVPNQLQLYGYSSNQALEILGVLSGMVIPVIFCPCVLTNSMSVLLLPAISEAHAAGDTKTIHLYIRRSVTFGTLLGFCCALGFLCFGQLMGNLLFANTLAGSMICKLSWLSPLLFVHSLFTGILQGLGKVGRVLLIQVLSYGIRFGGLFVLVPKYGISSLLWSMILAQLFSVIADLYSIQKMSQELA